MQMYIEEEIKRENSDQFISTRHAICHFVRRANQIILSSSSSINNIQQKKVTGNRGRKNHLTVKTYNTLWERERERDFDGSLWWRGGSDIMAMVSIWTLRFIVEKCPFFLCLIIVYFAFRLLVWNNTCYLKNK